MTRARALFRLAAVGCAALLLSGCISLLPKSKPAQLYRFGQSAAAAAPATGPLSRSVAVFRTNTRFAEEASDDRILTVTGGRAAYIAESRWVAPASVLFEEAVSNAFDAAKGPVRLIERGQQGKADYALRLEVRTFEARYSNPDAAPTVVVRLYAALSRPDLASAGERMFEAHVPAADNRVGAIVDAFDKATGDVIGQLVTWTEATAK
jgi:cholesterol transport system auxiliary component